MMLELAQSRKVRSKCDFTGPTAASNRIRHEWDHFTTPCGSLHNKIQGLTLIKFFNKISGPVERSELHPNQNSRLMFDVVRTCTAQD